MSGSSDLVAQKVNETRDALLRHSDAVDAKAGVLLGFAGAFVALSLAKFSWWRFPGIVVAIAAIVFCLRVFAPDRYPTYELRQFRDRYLNADLPFTLRHVIDTEIVMVERHAEVLRKNARRLRNAVQTLALATALLTLGTLIDRIGG